MDVRTFLIQGFPEINVVKPIKKGTLEQHEANTQWHDQSEKVCQAYLGRRPGNGALPLRGQPG
jgi:hypothetical protein